MKFFRKCFGHASVQRTLALVSGYVFLLTGALFLAYAVRFVGLDEWEFWKRGLLDTVFWLIPVQIFMLFVFRHFSGMLSYFRMPELTRVVQALFLALIVAIPIRYVQQISADADNAAKTVVVIETSEAVDKTGKPDSSDKPDKLSDKKSPNQNRPSEKISRRRLVATPWSVIFVDFVFAVVAVAGLRVFGRMLHEYLSGRSDAPAEPTIKKQRIAILGAGDAGAALAANWLARPGLRKLPVVFLDDNTDKHGMRIHNIPVAGSIDTLEKIKTEYEVDEVVISVGAANIRRFNEIVALTRRLGFRAEVVPSLVELASGRVKPSRIRPVDIQDLLGRDPAQLDGVGIDRLIRGRTVLVTGAGGSIGSELCRQIAARTPSRLLLVERCEVQLFQIEQDLLALGHNATIHPLVGDICDEVRMRHILAFFKPDLIFHAAAHKHVYLMERQPSEAVRNNTLGTRLLANLALEYGVEQFVLISTDKAINPTSVMGATKRMAELYVQALDASTGSGKTHFMAVRFGNVLGSSGSVVPIFRRQIAEGGPVRVTHPDVTRYFMTIPEAVGLVLQCAVLGKGGEIFVLNMGQPVRILDMARQMIELSGLRPDVDIQIEIIGLRPGEKLFEELQHTGEQYTPSEHADIMRFTGEPQHLEDINRALDRLATGIADKTANNLKREIQAIVPEYKPHLTE